MVFYHTRHHQTKPPNQTHKMKIEIQNGKKFFIFNLGFEKTTMRAIQTIARRFFRIPFPADDCPESLIVHHAVQFALTKPDEFQNFMKQLYHYEMVEGIDPIVYGREMVANHPSYRKNKFPNRFLPRIL